MKDVGVFQLKNGYWGFRCNFNHNGKKIDQKKTTDMYGNRLKTKREAVKAREEAMIELHSNREVSIERRTVGQVFKEYCDNGRMDKAYSTIMKQDSLWKNHISIAFGDRYVDEIAVAEINDFLSKLYYDNGFSYSYVEGFLKMFYLIFGQAYTRNYLHIDAYCKLCTNKSSKIHMPRMKIDDEQTIVSFSSDELAILDRYFKGTNVETAYMLGRYCGLRINECFGLKWSNVDFITGTIRLDRQMQYQEGLIKLVPLKTKNAKRTIYMNDILASHMLATYEQRTLDAAKYEDIRRQHTIAIIDSDGSSVLSTDMVNCTPKGRLLTLNSFKYHTRDIRALYGIDFKYHYLRHTYGTKLAEMNTPAYLLCNQMGHGNIQVTQKYYISVSDTGVEILKGNLDKL